jgi:CheY-like chemotaxis protein
MPKRVKSISVIGYSLSLLYLSSILVNVQAMDYLPFRRSAIILAFLYGILTLLSLMVVNLQEVARRYLVLFNAITCFYLLALSTSFPYFFHPSYILMHIVVVLFFIQRSMKVYFTGDWKVARKSILIVDDDQGVLKTVQGVLLANGYSVLTAATGEKGVQIAKLQRPDLILLDVILPGLKGREVCVKLKEDDNSKDIPVIFLTAKDSPDDIQAEKAVGGVSHLTKPVNAKMLLSEIKKVLG